MIFIVSCPGSGEGSGALQKMARAAVVEAQEAEARTIAHVLR
jgi:hypothetical protein